MVITLNNEMLIALSTCEYILKCHHKNSVSRIHFSKNDVFNSDVENQLTHKQFSTSQRKAIYLLHFFKEFKNENCVCFFALQLFAGMSVSGRTSTENLGFEYPHMAVF